MFSQPFSDYISDETLEGMTVLALIFINDECIQKNMESKINSKLLEPGQTFFFFFFFKSMQLRKLISHIDTSHFTVVAAYMSSLLKKVVFCQKYVFIFSTMSALLLVVNTVTSRLS